MTIEAPKMLGLRDDAYTRWQSANAAAERGVSKDEFWKTLSAQERRAIFAGDLNYQVCNGGFAQWIDNGYGVDETFAYLIGLCAELRTVATGRVKELLHAVNAARATYEESENENDEGWSAFFAATEDLSTAFYEVNEAFVHDVEKTL